MATVHLDTDFLVHATLVSGPERARLVALSESAESVQMSAVAWYEYARGPRTPEQLALARFFLDEEGVVPLTEDLAERAADVYRRLGSPRRRANDIAIGVTALHRDATLLTRNGDDFGGIDGLRVEAAGERPTDTE